MQQNSHNNRKILESEIMSLREQNENIDDEISMLKVQSEQI